MSPPWRPLLSGVDAARALAAARDIAAATRRGTAWLPDRVAPAGIPVWENALSGGRAGQCLLHAYLALEGPGDAHAARAAALLDQATDAAAVVPMSASLSVGWPGIAWAAAHVRVRLSAGDEDGIREVDKILLRSLRRGPWEGAYDLLHGLVGLGIYARERLPRRDAVRCLGAVVAQLAGRAEHTAEGATFLSPAGTLDPKYASHFPRGGYVLGMASGVGGVVALLGAACQAGVASNLARPLLADTVAWLLARERPSGSSYRFPICYFPGVEPFGSRPAWGIGDLGIAASLLLAARGAGEPAWEREARRLALAAAARSSERRQLISVGLCQGDAGVGHVLNRLYQTTGEPTLGKAARLWFRRVLSRRQPGLGIGGFRMARGGDGSWVDEPGFLDGATGIGLALLAAASHVEPAWDRVLLVS